MPKYPVQGVGLGLRRAFIGSVADHVPDNVDFMEISPENWIDVGGRFARQLRRVLEQVPMLCHGLSLNIGGPAPLDEPFIRRIRQFLDENHILCYSEHLTYCADDGHLYDLMPIPFTGEAVHHVAERIRRTQDILGRRLALENASYYAAPGKEMEEIDFINAVIEEADCDLLLDINNIYVNSINHRYDAESYLQALPGDRIAYAHIAGHYVEAEDIRVDTHGTSVIDPVWQLLERAYEHFGVSRPCWNGISIFRLCRICSTKSPGSRKYSAVTRKRPLTTSVSKSDRPSLREQQYLFTRHMRDPEGAPAPADVEERRLAIYRDLLYRNVEKFMAGSYPVIRRIIPDEQWHALIRGYFRDHQACTPLFPRMPQEFLHYLEGLEELPEGYPFLLELAHYEWVELAVSLDTREIDFSEVDTQGDLLDGVPVLSPLAMPLAYHYPVHRIRPDYLPDRPPDTPTRRSTRCCAR